MLRLLLESSSKTRGSVLMVRRVILSCCSYLLAFSFDCLNVLVFCPLSTRLFLDFFGVLLYLGSGIVSVCRGGFLRLPWCFSLLPLCEKCACPFSWSGLEVTMDFWLSCVSEFVVGSTSIVPVVSVLVSVLVSVVVVLGKTILVLVDSVVELVGTIVLSIVSLLVLGVDGVVLSVAVEVLVATFVVLVVLSISGVVLVDAVVVLVVSLVLLCVAVVLLGSSFV
jgi:hypothetical protein